MTIATSDAVREAARQLEPETVRLRRDFHQHPELAFEEVRTAGIVAEQLSGLGLEVRSGVGRTGVLGVLDSGRPGRTVLARADMDALPIYEERESEYRSLADGKMHACGHDGHTAVLLSAARILAGARDELSGRVVFVFQPAEETVGGAGAMIADGALSGLRPDASIGLHLLSDYPVGTIALRPGPSMAAADAFRMVISGRGGHAAMPHKTVDPVLIAARLITGVQSLVSRETDPLDQSVISITSVHGGTASNIIPESVELLGTLRTFRAETRSYLKERLASFARSVAAGHQGGADIAWVDESPAVVNDEAMTARMREVARGVVDSERVLTSTPIMGGDDMALWLQQAPGCYFFVGARNEAAGIDKPHHHPRFDIDEAALPVAVEALTKGILDYLQ